MPFQTVRDEALLGVHIQIQQDTGQSDPQKAFQAVLNVPGTGLETLPINNQSSVSFPLHFGAINGQVEADVADFCLVGGATPDEATGVTFKIVFKVDVLFGKLTVGSVDVTAALKRP